MTAAITIPVSGCVNPHLQSRWRCPRTGGRMVWKAGALWAAEGAAGHYRQVPGVDSYERADALARSLGLVRWGGRDHNRGPAVLRAIPAEPAVDNRVSLAIVPRVVPSASAPGHAERMARHGERAALWLPLFADGPADPPARGNGSAVLPECWGCGGLAPSPTFLARHGWMVRPAFGARHLRGRVEVYCPDCFAEWGWPDGPDA